MTAAASLLALALAARVAVPAAEPPSRARYLASRQDAARGLALPSHESWGWSQRARLLPDGSTEITVVSEPGGLPVPPVPRRTGRPLEADVALAAAPLVSDEVRLVAGEVSLGAADDWETSLRLLTWVSVNVRHADDPGHDESAEATLRARVASCVGRSRLAAELLLAAGIPARTVHGLLADPHEGRPFLLHRFVESWIDGLGWVPSDPGESIHVVDARHVFIAAETGTYDPESQRGLHLRIAELPDSPLASLGPPGLRPLAIRERPAALLGGSAR